MGAAGGDVNAARTGVETVVVGLSGGVDSAVAAALLVERGYTVIGATMRVWGGGPSADSVRHACYGPDEAEDAADARRVADALGIAFHELDLVEEYRRYVLTYFREEYRSGRTPNPCVRCNQRLKFGFLADRLAAEGVAFDRFATGHYARVRQDPSSGRWALARGVDRGKDQSYFLAMLTQDQLARALFPLGDMSKDEVRSVARGCGLGVADKDESQDFASQGHVALLGDGGAPGPIVDRGGRELGRHRGIGRYTVGQRKGLGVSAGRPLYVVAIDVVRNAVVVGSQTEATSAVLRASGANWVAAEPGTVPRRVAVRIRHNHEPAAATVEDATEDRLVLRFDEPQFAVTPGQTAVCYREDDVLVAAVID